MRELKFYKHILLLILVGTLFLLLVITSFF